VFDAAVIESRSLWNLRFEVAIASGMAAERVPCIVYRVCYVQSREPRGWRSDSVDCSNSEGCVSLFVA
jgi:hypothetical protein